MDQSLRTKPRVEDGITVQATDGPVWLVEYQPGNGYRYVIVLSQLRGLPLRARQTLGVNGQDGVLVTISGPVPGQFVSDGDGFLHYSFLREKLRCSIGQAVVLAEILGTLLGREFVTCDEFARESA